VHERLDRGLRPAARGQQPGQRLLVGATPLQHVDELRQLPDDEVPCLGEVHPRAARLHDEPVVGQARGRIALREDDQIGGGVADPPGERNELGRHVGRPDGEGHESLP
jgi:hypothetical protein